MQNFHVHGQRKTALKPFKWQYAAHEKHGMFLLPDKKRDRP